MPCRLPETQRMVDDPQFQNPKKQIRPCMIDNAKAIHAHTKTAELALQRPVVQFRDGFGYAGPNGCMIDRDSFMRNGTILTQTGGKQTLANTGYLTVPYMGHGRNNTCTSTVVLESKGTSVTKSCLPATERTNFIPMLGCLATQVQNPKHIIPEDARSGWVRGGISTRSCVKKVKR